MRPRRVDSNHRQIVQELRQVGAEVLDLHTLGGALDLLVGFRGRLVLIEVKDGNRPPSRRKLTTAEERTVDRFRLVGCPVVVATSLEELLSAIGAV